MTRPTVLLFDIDGTLVTTGGAGRRAIERAFEQTHGRRDACTHFSFAGMTDRAIMRRGLEALEADSSEAAIDAVVARYLEALADEVARADDASYRVFPGVREAVEAGLDAGMAVGLGTGNVEAGARLKLERVRLWRHFGFGGFGDDHEVRPRLIERGAQRGAARLGLTVDEARVVVIGDTPRDVEAALAIGAECLAVATGGFDEAALREAGATHVFGTLAAPGALDAMLGRTGG